MGCSSTCTCSVRSPRCAPPKLTHIQAISIANVLVPILGPDYMANWLASLQRVLHSVLTTRVLLLIRGQIAATRRFTQLDPHGGEAIGGFNLSASSATRTAHTGLAFADMPPVSGMSDESTLDYQEDSHYN
ncbi:hypothetical protein C8F01DRAFT_640044 [Mycena amicta]|nr:hypothetical protein C8F01DRAFT_640044 [Mycena amicta]